MQHVGAHRDRPSFPTRRSSDLPPCGAMRGFGAVQVCFAHEAQMDLLAHELDIDPVELRLLNALKTGDTLDRKSTRLNSSHLVISYAVFCLKKKKKKQTHQITHR